MALEQTHPSDWNKIYMELASLIGKENTILLYTHYKGAYINFPMRLLSKEGLQRIVYSEFNGNNSRDIAKKYGYSVRHINRVVQEKSSSK
ncbi:MULTISPECIES: Mor transcription activator family protein [Streptococcus]|uniref:Mor transcription activator domain-containing protein n=3 Tax=Streptococcus TaxID=1301 RepID=A0A3S9MRA1_9STRE|nr:MULTISPECIES: Mor transcription activator family protein [Streptococcus]GAD39606.1 hypothetical protein ANG3_0069 [Streptococcus intermedius SK54 = ATCC 27335]AGU83472.1 putative positive regulator of late transcription [Streptococcus anginosus C238]AZQ41747.1 hypothetical protein EHW89_04440 [Streptococcus periodonticum]MBX9101071.1 hypothetical protein [Streptococcus anginosus]MBZ2155257.1 hypothetical protein [Streptococcus anginosus]